MAEWEIDNLTMEQYLALTRGNQAPGVVKPEIEGNANFEIKSQFIIVMMLSHAVRFLINTLLVASYAMGGTGQFLQERPVDYTDLLKKAFIQSHQKVNIFYNGLRTWNAQELLDSTRAAIPGMTTLAHAFTAIHTCAEPLPKKLGHTTLNSVEEAKYGVFGRPLLFSNGAKYRVSPPGYYTCINNQPLFGEKRPSLEELMNKHLEESTRRRAEVEEWVKKL
ncbi:hypothetical protein Tco_0972462 [Tanacetum coccineum]